jgi:riboflavin kinase/FMN adenylyltransferase
MGGRFSAIYGSRFSGYIVCVHRFTTLESLKSLDRPLHLALGVFDGVHVGHQAVIGRAVEAARKDDGIAVVVTFDPHPIRVMAPDKAPKALLATLNHKAHFLAKHGVGALVALHFDDAFAGREAGEFLGDLMACRPRTLAVGEDWRFGRGRGGDITLLRGASVIYGFRLEAVPPVMLDGERVSSTRIRQAIRDGNLRAAEDMLGRRYTVSGEVVEGRKLGRTIGFPTANVDTGDAQLPPDGVWAVRVSVEDGEPRPGVANLGLRPTVDGATRMLEAYLFDFSGDLYGREIEVEFCQFLRGERKFDNMEALRGQIGADARQARQLLEAGQS